MRKKRKTGRYNDGIAKLYQKKEGTRNVKTLEDLEYIGHLCFEEKSCRQSDIEFAEQRGKQLKMKIATQNPGETDTNKIIVIENVIYSIIHIDRSKGTNEVFFYLEEVRKIG